MTIPIEPIKIKQSMYLLIPKNIAQMIDLDESSKTSLVVKNDNTKCTLEYHIRSKS